MGTSLPSKTLAGFSDIEDGITVDLSAINTVQLDPSAKIISVGAGARWQSVYNALDPYGLSVQGGRTGSVGVGGFLTGGNHFLLLISYPILY
jgi:FAD/FMN-containing dehydrogenase